MLSNDIIKRLVFIRYMFEKAVEQSYKPFPMSQMSILTFHDSVELFLYLASEYLVEVPKSGYNFKDYYKIILDKADIELSQGIQMDKLNKSRVELKHRGVNIHDSQIEEFRVNCKNFFEENTKLVFDINFSDISLADLVNHELVRNNLKEAQQLLSKNDVEAANNKVAIAFFILIDHFEKEESKYYGSPLNSGYYSGCTVPSEFDDVESAMDDLSYEIDDVRESLKIIAMGIDYYQHQKFIKNTPRVYRRPNGNFEFNSRLTKKNLNEEDVKFEINFVIESSIALQELFPI